MADTFLTISSSTNAEAEITPISTSAGSGSAGKIFVTDGNGKVDNSFLYAYSETTLTAGESITGPALTYITSTGTVKNADNTSMVKAAQGFCPNSIANTATGLYNAGPGTLGGFTGLTQGAPYFLSTVGGITATPPAAGSGNVYQMVGYALNATTLQFEPKQPIQR